MVLSCTGIILTPSPLARHHDHVHRSGVCHYVPHVLRIPVRFLGAWLESRYWIPVVLEHACWYSDFVCSCGILFDQVLPAPSQNTRKGPAGGSATAHYAWEYYSADRALLVWLDVFTVDFMGATDHLWVLYRFWSHAHLHQWHHFPRGHLSSVSSIGYGSKHVCQKRSGSRTTPSSANYVSQARHSVGDKLAGFPLRGFDSSSIPVLQVWRVAEKEIEVRSVSVGVNHISTASIKSRKEGSFPDNTSSHSAHKLCSWWSESRVMLTHSVFVLHRSQFAGAEHTFCNEARHLSAQSDNLVLASTRAFGLGI